MKESKTSIDELARMVKNGFDDITNNLTGEINSTTDGLRKDIANLRDQNDKDHQDIKMRLDNVAYRFEFQDLERRVLVLEKRAK